MKKLIAFLLVFLMLFSYAGAVTLTLGSRGETVKQLQQALIERGYLQGEADGIFGAKTQEAVKKFQKDNGLTVDGIAGDKTLAALKITGNTVNSDSDVYLIARAVYGEARGEIYVGKVAVAAIILNRVASADFPNSVAGVIYQPGAFDAVADGQINLSPDEECIRAARDAFAGWDPTNGCLYYYNPATATNKWMLSKPVLFVAGNHSFCK